MQENNTQSTPTKNNKSSIIVLIAIVAIVIVLVVGLVAKLKNNKPSEDVTHDEKKITLNAKELGNDKILISIDNEKEGIYDVDFNVTFYDENKNIVRVSEEKAYAISSNKTFYHIVKANGFLDGNYTYDITMKNVVKKDENKILSNKITKKSTKKDNVIEIELANTSSETIDTIQISVIYFNQNEPVNYTTQSITGLIGNVSIIEIVKTPTDENGKLIEFDKHEVIITAYNLEK